MYSVGICAFVFIKPRTATCVNINAVQIGRVTPQPCCPVMETIERGQNHSGFSDHFTVDWFSLQLLVAGVCLCRHIPSRSLVSVGLVKHWNCNKIVQNAFLWFSKSFRPFDNWSRTLQCWIVLYLFCVKSKFKQADVKTIMQYYGNCVYFNGWNLHMLWTLIWDSIYFLLPGARGLS